MFHSGTFFRFVALPYELVASTAVWERHCAFMATKLPPGAKRVLDLGCGPGNSTVHLRDTVGDGVLGGDYAVAMLKRAQRRDRRLRLAAMDAGRLPLKDGSVDAVTFHSVLYLLPDRAAALREVARVLRPGGRAVLLEPQDGRTISGLLKTLPTPHWAITATLWRTMSRAYGRFTKPSMRAALETAGLRVVELEDAFNGLGLTAVAEK